MHWSLERIPITTILSEALTYPFLSAYLILIAAGLKSDENQEYRRNDFLTVANLAKDSELTERLEARWQDLSSSGVPRRLRQAETLTGTLRIGVPVVWRFLLSGDGRRISSSLSKAYFEKNSYGTSSGLLVGLMVGAEKGSIDGLATTAGSLSILLGAYVGGALSLARLIKHAVSAESANAWK